VKDFVRALTGLAEIHNEPLSEERIRGYVATLQDLGETRLVVACRYFAKHLKWFPKPADFVQLLTKGSIEPASSESEAMIAWARVQTVLTNATQVRRLCESDPRIAAGVAACGGWYTMLHGGEDPKWQRRAFVRAFCGKDAETKRDKLQIESGQVKHLVEGVAGRLAQGGER